ncbi:MAG: transposase [Microcoleus vaginatus WJT46-NPBG5]|nr:transposase [Microcoleus vaginatus WJT46-NPBG5]
MSFPKPTLDSLNILQLDNGRFHTSKDLVIPDNVILLFQPPYCPELNPIERLWSHLKQDLHWASFTTLYQFSKR